MGPPTLMEIPVEGIEASFSIIQSYLAVLGWILPTMMIIGGYIVLRHIIWDSLRFNYYHYLKYGEFVLFWGDNDGDPELREQRKGIAKKLKIDAYFVSWFAALSRSVVVFIGFVLTACLWPITFILVMPLGIVRLIGYRKRKKVVFTQKLKGEHLET